MLSRCFFYMFLGFSASRLLHYVKQAPGGHRTTTRTAHEQRTSRINELHVVSEAQGCSCFVRRFSVPLTVSPRPNAIVYDRPVRLVKCSSVHVSMVGECPSRETLGAELTDHLTDAVPKKRGPKTDVLEALLKRVDGLERRLKDEQKQPNGEITSATAGDVGSISSDPKQDRPQLDTINISDESAVYSPTSQRLAGMFALAYENRLTRYQRPLTRCTARCPPRYLFHAMSWQTIPHSQRNHDTSTNPTQPSTFISSLCHICGQRQVGSPVTWTRHITGTKLIFVDIRRIQMDTVRRSG